MAKRPHRYPASMVGPDSPGDVLAWKCAHCGEWIKDYEPRDERTECPGAPLDGTRDGPPDG